MANKSPKKEIQFKKDDPRINRKGQPSKEKKVTGFRSRNRAIGMALQGVPYRRIAEVLGVAVDTLHKYLGKDLRDAREQCFSRVASSVYEKAIRGEDERIQLDAAKFILTHQGRWAQTVKNEHTGPDGGPIQTLDMSQFTTEELEAIEALQKQKLTEAQKNVE